MLVYLGVALFYLIESLSERNQWFGLYFRFSIGFGVGLIFIVDQLERSRFPNLAIMRIAIRTYLRLPTLGVDSFAYLGAGQVVNPGSP